MLIEIIGGFTFAEDPACDTGRAVIAWTATQNRAVIALDVEPAEDGNGYDFLKYQGRGAVIIDGRGKEHIILNDGRSQIAADLKSGSALSGPVSLKLFIPNNPLVGLHLTYLQKLLAALEHPDGRIRAPRDRAMAQKLVAALRVHDALAAGASQRDIAIALFGKPRINSDWSGASDALRSQIRRQITRARRLSKGEWRQISR
jgi:hypothetical protein